MEYAREALAEATTKKTKERINGAIQICEANIAAGVRIPLHVNGRRMPIATSTHK